MGSPNRYVKIVVALEMKRLRPSCRRRNANSLPPATRDLITPLRAEGLRLVGLSLIGVSLAYLAFHWALDYASVIQVATFVTTMPIWVGLINRWLTGEPFTLVKVLTGIMALLGIALLITDGYLSALAGIAPEHKGNQLDGQQLARLFEAAQDVLRKAIECRADPARMPDDWLTPRREERDDTCPRCGHRLETRKVGGRTAHFCPHCQA
jgi:energy-converting hydrogenase Eha subunit E